MVEVVVVAVVVEEQDRRQFIANTMYWGEGLKIPQHVVDDDDDDDDE